MTPTDADHLAQTIDAIEATGARVSACGDHLELWYRGVPARADYGEDPVATLEALWAERMAEGEGVGDA